MNARFFLLSCLAYTSSAARLTVRRFSVKWCPVCQKFAPEWDTLKSHHSNVAFESVDCDVDPCTEIKKFPTVFFETQDDTFEYTGGWTAKEMSAEISLFLATVQSTTTYAATKTTGNVTVTDVIWGANSTLERVNFLFEENDMLSFDVSEHIRNFVDALSKFVPEYAAMNAIFKSQMNYHAALHLVAPSISRDVWYEALQYAPPLIHERTPTDFCHTSACAVWVMMHAVSVSVDPSATAVFHTAQLVAETFPCKDCAERFNRTIWNPSSPFSNTRVCDDGAIMWLVAAHNEVNARLNRPQYPTALDCPKCISEKDIVDFTRETYTVEPQTIQAPSIYIGACALSGPIAALFLELGKRNGLL